MKIAQKILFILLFLAQTAPTIAQFVDDQDTICYNDPITAMLDSLVTSNLMQRSGFSEQLVKCEIPYECKTFTEYEYRARLQKLNSAIPLDYNESVRHYIELYANRRPGLTSRVLGLSQLYFPIFESVLDREGLPLEFKYLAIVESALNPVAVSKAGATGIWQFMYATGKMYNLKISSFIDERRDPYKATEAACKYFKDMYKIYQDWLLVIAAYNCGERNVNKAIIRSGGKTNFWQIKRYLPLETQGYVPAFIAVNFVMNYYAEYGINVSPPPITFFETDTIGVEHHLTFSSVAASTGVPEETIRFLNPLFKKNFIPFTGDEFRLILPSDKTTVFISNADKIYEGSISELEKTGIKFRYVTSEKKKIHVVKKGETLASIAKKNDCSITDIKQWNKLKTKTVPPGKKLTIYYTSIEKVFPNDSSVVAPTDSLVAKNVTDTLPAIVSESEPKIIYYEIQPNDTLFSISKKFNGVTVEQLKEHNKDVLKNPNILVPGSKIKVVLGG